VAGKGCWGSRGVRKGCPRTSPTYHVNTDISQTSHILTISPITVRTLETPRGLNRTERADHRGSQALCQGWRSLDLSLVLKIHY
jgi:hypothetical protein